MINVLCVMQLYLNVLSLQIFDSKTRLLKEKGKEIENKTNKHIRNKYTYSNKTTTITTENINNNSFQKNLPFIHNDYNNSCC